MASITVGKKIPAINALTTEGRIWRLKESLGHKIVLFFYPRDMTPGCTIEAQQFRDLHKSFIRANTLILGVSRDSCASHIKFSFKESLKYELISDTDEKLCDLFDVIREKNMYGKKVFGIERSTFLIDKKGYLAQEWRTIKAEGHAETVLAATKAL